MYRKLLIHSLGALLLCIVALFPLRAFAWGVVQEGANQTWGWYGQASAPYPNRQAACTAFAESHTQADQCGTFVPVGTVNGDNCSAYLPDFQRWNGNYCGGAAATTWNTSLWPSSVPGCPENSQAYAGHAGQCVCGVDFKAVGSSCVAQSCNAVLGGLLGSTLSWPGTGITACFQGCMFSAGVRGYLSSTNTSSASGEHLIGAGTCAGAPADGNGPDVTSGEKCSTGKCPGTVNGVHVCVPCSNKSETGPSASASAPAGAASANLEGAPPGSVSSEEKTECIGGNCVTTTTWRNEGGEVTGSRDDEQTEKSFCAENPGSSLCIESEISGACAQVACSGDAIQCAMAREQAKRACEFFEPTGAAVDAGTAAGSGGDRPEGHPGREGVETSLALSTLLDQTNRLSGSCPPDQSFTVMGSVVALPISKVCEPAALVGQLAVGLCVFAAAFIVFRN